MVVEDLFGATSFRHVYLLDIRATDADFVLTTAASEFAGARGRLKTPVTIERSAGMSGDVSVLMEGAAQGVREDRGRLLGQGGDRESRDAQSLPRRSSTPARFALSVMQRIRPPCAARPAGRSRPECANQRTVAHPEGPGCESEAVARAAWNYSSSAFRQFLQRR